MPQHTRAHIKLSYVFHSECNKPQRTQMFIAEGKTPRDYEN